MKYPWTALSITIIWLATTFVIINRAGLDVNEILLITLTGTMAISFIGFSAPSVKK